MPEHDKIRGNDFGIWCKKQSLSVKYMDNGSRIADPRLQLGATAPRPFLKSIVGTICTNTALPELMRLGIALMRRLNSGSIMSR